MIGGLLAATAGHAARAAGGVRPAHGPGAGPASASLDPFDPASPHHVPDAERTLRDEDASHASLIVSIAPRRCRTRRLAAGCNRKPATDAAATPAAPQVTVVKPEMRPVKRVVEQPGTVQAFEETALLRQAHRLRRRSHRRRPGQEGPPGRTTGSSTSAAG